MSPLAPITMCHRILKISSHQAGNYDTRNAVQPDCDRPGTRVHPSESVRSMTSVLGPLDPPCTDATRPCQYTDDWLLDKGLVSLRVGAVRRS